MEPAAVDPPFAAGSMVEQTSAAAPPLPRVLPPEAAAEQLGSCTLLLLDLPKPKRKTSPSAEARAPEDDEELQLGLDCSMWRVGPHFSGVKCIQPGCHLLYSRINRAEISAAELAGHVDAAEKAVAAEDAAAAAASPDTANVDAGAPAAVDDISAPAPQEGGFECMYTAMRVEEAIGEVGREKRGGLQRAEFIYMEPHAICVRRWDRRSKNFLRLTDEDEEQRYIRGVKRLEFDKKLGVYPQQFRHVWGLLTDFISRQCLRRLEPLSRSFTAAALPLSAEEQQRLQQRLGEEVAEGATGAAVLEAADEENEKRARQPHTEEEEEMGVRFYFTEIPPVRTAAVAAARRAEARAKHCGATAAEAAAAAATALTEAAVDRTDTLLQVLKKINKRLDDLEDASSRKQSAAAASRRTLAELMLHCAPLPHSAVDAAAAAAAAAVEEERREEERLWRSLASSEACQDLLGELQLSYLAFLLGQRYDGFEQWKQLLTFLSQCARAVRLLPEFYASLLRVFYCQIEQCPHDFLQDPLLQRSFLVASAASLVNICSNVAPLEDGTGAYASGDNDSMDTASLEGEEALVDRAERKAVLQRVEQRAAWLQQLLTRTFGETLADPVVSLLPNNASSAATTLEQLRRQGLTSSSMHEEEEDGPVVVDESELLRAGVLLDDSDIIPSSQEPRQQHDRSSNPLTSVDSGESYSSTGQESSAAGGSCMDVDTGQLQ